MRAIFVESLSALTFAIFCTFAVVASVPVSRTVCVVGMKTFAAISSN